MVAQTRPRYTAGLNRTNTAYVYAMYRSPAYGYTDPSDAVSLAPGGTAAFHIDVQSADFGRHQVQWSVTAPQGLRLAPADGELTVSPSDRAGGTQGQSGSTATVTVSSAATTSLGRYTLRVSFRADGRTDLPPATVTVTVTR